MDEYQTILEVRFPEPHGEEGSWHRYDEVLDPYYSNVTCIGDWDEDSMMPRTPTECAEGELEHALDTVIDEQYLTRVVRGGTMVGVMSARTPPNRPRSHAPTSGRRYGGSTTSAET
ncbi:hypothetical protein ABZX98_32580 [Streptomyces sp. NPDC002992]|uniref:hypothetical protein n=1 Tax=Streptomyces sp. NPDC002992 TaxID=3154273 RepID=UPI0033A1666C